MSDIIAKAVHQLLANSPVIQDVLGETPRLYDHAPEDPVFPYLSYGPMRSEERGADDTALYSHQMTLHLWSRYAGRSEVLILMEQLKSVLRDQSALATYLTEATLISATVRYADVLRAPDGRTHHGLLRLSILTEH